MPSTDDLSIVVRQMPDDNSCLFRAVGFLLDRNPNSPAKYREMIATRIQSDRSQYSDAMLGRSNDEYVRLIQRPNSWGGAIELAIFSQLFHTELVAFDITNMKVYNFGEGNEYTKRAYLIYSGIHYDAVAGTMVQNPALDEPTEFDVTIFSPADSATFAKVYEIAQAMHDANQFTDTAKYSLKCAKCGARLVGNTGAQQHAAQTGHVDFEETH